VSDSARVTRRQKMFGVGNARLACKVQAPYDAATPPKAVQVEMSVNWFEVQP
jgi:hypothetical protein